jgi:uncharacterized membrane protein
MHTEKTSIGGVAANVIAAASYLVGFVTGLIVLTAEKKNRFVRFHAMQSTIFFAIAVGLQILLKVISFGPFGFLLFLFVVFPVSAVVWLLMMYKAYQGDEYKLPIVGEWAAERTR